ncbi:metalloregulator ArsR/SmtB family transcription factor [Streptomyces sp. NPDC048106]|uniref:ArsR/SmtB family transcription factor n=1 Tax=Streptomyces sp. NPDC048106 TaxID=3155750 RepID=UPI003452887F
MTSHDPVDPPVLFKTLADPMRWTIVQELAGTDGEYPCSLLEEALPLSKPTISYHIKLLAQVGLIETRKRGRKYFYVLRHDILQDAVRALSLLMPQTLSATEPAAPSTAARTHGTKGALGTPPRERDPEATLVTW